MSALPNLRPPEQCRWDMVALGEVMLRFDPGERRVRNARSFDVWEGGGEYNVVRAMARTFDMRGSVVTALPDNDLGRLADDLIAQGGVDRSHILWREADGMGRNTRLGLNFTERGFGVRPARGLSDRANSAASQMRPGEIDWDRLFGDEGVRWLHTGGIFAALSTSTAEVAIEAVEAARRHGVVVSYDLNYRASLWDSHPDPDAARRVNRAIAGAVDVMIGDGYGFETCLGIDLKQPKGGSDAGLGAPAFAAAAEAFSGLYPQAKVVAATLRRPSTASRNDWSAAAWSGGELHTAPVWADLEILDRVGGGDSFVSGLAWALMNGLSVKEAVAWGAAHGALAMTTPGDASMVSRDEIAALLAGGDGRSIR
ncbi:sugar kinase [Brevundimonas sp. Root1423]|uniref:sugar kinase n=1 Tax=Brevundimonas sp. Root1423 TaxID=1736462 RepID=UPI0006F93FAB|nr:sugar kinase [Brevundimonas sp. Root1423]KQY75449.1 sugar kinase [Brevundimonas sp. Root1423]